MSCLFRPMALGGLLILSLFGPAPQARGDDRKEPYRVRIVVDVEKHRLLTDIFREQVSREIRDGLKSALGELATVSVTNTDPLLAEIHARGLGRALDGMRWRSPERIYFVEIGYTGTHYRIRTRMLDGLTGLPSPVVRRADTRDRAYVARTATLLLERDLGLLGTVTGEPDRQGVVPVELRGASLGIDLGRWVKKGELFSLVKVEGAAPGSPVPWSVLRVVEPPQDGVCRCKLFSRYKLDRLTGLRAVLLGTTSGPLRLRLLEEKDDRSVGPLQTGVAVDVRRDGFSGEEGSKVRLLASRGRDLDTSASPIAEHRVFDKVAFVTVLSEGRPLAQMPVPILDDRVVVAGVPPANDRQALLRFRCRMLVQGVRDAAEVQAEMFRDINSLSGKPEQRATAIARIKETLRRSRDDYDRLTAERDRVREALGKEPQPLRGLPPMPRIDARLRQLKSAEGELKRTVAALEKIEQDANEPETKEWLLQKEKAHLLETEGDIEKAIAIYEKAPEKFQTAKLKQHLVDLKKLWEPVSPEHRAARKFILETYPALATSQLTKENIDRAQKALEVCQKAGDLIGPPRLRRATLEHVKRLDAEASALNPSVNIDDEKPLKQIQEILPQLRKLVEEVNAYLEAKKP